MSLSSHAPRRMAAVAVAAVAGLAGLQHAPAAAAPTAAAPATSSPAATVSKAGLPVPTRAARAAGVQPGNAPMGWRSALTRQAPAVARKTGPVLAAKAFVPSGVLGMDVSSYQGKVKWAKQAKAGKQFVYIKATEGTKYRNPYFRSQYDGSYDAGLIRGAYHFASPSGSSGKTQAASFVKHGGAWTPDGHTLPGVLDIEYNPYGSTCYGVSKKKMVSWVNSFVVEYKRLTTRDAVIYTTTDWWTRCTGNTKRFSLTNPLWLARYGTKDPGKLPGTWQWATFWQYTSTPFDQDQFSSKRARLLVLAKNAR